MSLSIVPSGLETYTSGPSHSFVWQPGYSHEPMTFKMAKFVEHTDQFAGSKCYVFSSLNIVVWGRGIPAGYHILKRYHI